MPVLYSILRKLKRNVSTQRFSINHAFRREKLLKFGRFCEFLETNTLSVSN